MKTMINLAMKFSGLGWVWGKVDGYKVYGTSTILILTGLLGVLNLLGPAIAAHDAGALFAILKTIPHNDSWIMLVQGVMGLGIGHKLNKAADVAAE